MTMVKMCIISGLCINVFKARVVFGSIFTQCVVLVRNLVRSFSACLREEEQGL